MEPAIMPGSLLHHDHPTPSWYAYAARGTWAAQYNTSLLIESTPKAVVAAFLFFQPGIHRLI